VFALLLLILHESLFYGVGDSDFGSVNVRKISGSLARSDRSLELGLVERLVRGGFSVSQLGALGDFVEQSFRRLSHFCKSKRVSERKK